MQTRIQHSKAKKIALKYVIPGSMYMEEVKIVCHAYLSLSGLVKRCAKDHPPIRYSGACPLCASKSEILRLIDAVGGYVDVSDIVNSASLSNLVLIKEKLPVGEKTRWIAIPKG